MEPSLANPVPSEVYAWFGRRRANMHVQSGLVLLHLFSYIRRESSGGMEWLGVWNFFGL